MRLLTGGNAQLGRTVHPSLLLPLLGLHISIIDHPFMDLTAYACGDDLAAPQKRRPYEILESGLV